MPATKLDCKYGSKCYQKNAQHLAKFKHPEPLEPSVASKRKSSEPSNEPAPKVLKLDKASPKKEAIGKPAKPSKLYDMFKVKETTSSLKKEGTSSPKKDATSPKKEATSAPKEKATSSPKEKTISSPNKELTSSSKIICHKEENVKQTVTSPKSDDCEWFADDVCLASGDPGSLALKIKLMFLVDMPQDFFDFYKFCSEIEPNSPRDALSSINLRLVGAFDILAGDNLLPSSVERFLCHWRYYYDPPEMQTVLAHTGSGLHFGYFRDDPSEPPVFVAAMGGNEAKPHLVNPQAGNLFDAVRNYCKESEKKAVPFQKAAYVNMAKKIESVAEKYSFEIDTKSVAVKKRRPYVVCRTLHGAGLVVPYDKKTEIGYREVPETDACLWRMLTKVADAKSPESRRTLFCDVQELITNAQWATDEGDCGMSLELGLALFLHGCDFFHKSAQHLMGVAYSLLQRDAFGTILKAHLKNRRKGNDMNSFQSKYIKN